MFYRICLFFAISLSLNLQAADENKEMVSQLVEAKKWQFRNASFNFEQARFDVDAAITYQKPPLKGSKNYKKAITLSKNLIQQNRGYDFLVHLATLIEPGKDTISVQTIMDYKKNELLELRDTFKLGSSNTELINQVAKAIIAYYVSETRGLIPKTKQLEEIQKAFEQNPEFSAAVDDLNCFTGLNMPAPSPATTLFSPSSTESMSDSPALLSPFTQPGDNQDYIPCPFE